ncbi:multidrug transporter EmrE-like cation transporter [Trinickia symbiotica]|uniref:EamA family transporter n=1 Tax=Trinickia symbiotica TaxID=863227 RepID=A0A2N7X179_9BURK|nr:DMT family transporter [Trinickia symbiotica]PMS35486.1 EamA family transporter [Trinickia symbiotica]PPK45517.1 multidrug transporter EmrE-like cation transporter [Trinickia symbiotica]
MPTNVMLLVLFAAFLHASWNAVVKSSPDKLLDIVLVTCGAAVLCAIALPFLPFPARRSWPYIAASIAIHIVYFVLIGAAYRSGDMGHAYPLMRGTPPLVIALLSGPIIGEHLSAGEWSGILLICAGVLGLLLANPGGRSTIETTRLALANALVIAVYSLVDGTGARLSGHPVSYTMYMFLFTGPSLLAWAIVRRKGDVRAYIGARWYLALAGGACTLSAYVLVLWAMTRAPIAMVAALRETAILFGTAISTFLLKERPGYGRPIASVVILLGVIALKLT